MPAMLEELLQQLARRSSDSGGGDVARQLYVDININGLEEDTNEGKAASFERHKDAILPVLIKGKSCESRLPLLCGILIHACV